jgi:hypothetical protein
VKKETEASKLLRRNIDSVIRSTTGGQILVDDYLDKMDELDEELCALQIRIYKALENLSKKSLGPGYRTLSEYRY